MKIQNDLEIKSKFLNRTVVIDIGIPPGYNINKPYSLLLMNDGQDFKNLGMDLILEKFWNSGGQPFVYVGIHSNENRLKEYGTIAFEDYKGRGAEATNYASFIKNELFPSLKNHINIQAKGHSFCGFSLGGLAAFDFVLENASLFSQIGVFSGAFWWRTKGYEDGYDNEKDRIIHQKVKSSQYKSNLKFWFQCGTEDEQADRNNNGIIDAIEDTLDLIEILVLKGYTNKGTIHYEEIIGGKHELRTWKEVMPNFLTWAFGQ